MNILLLVSLIAFSFFVTVQELF